MNNYKPTNGKLKITLVPWKLLFRNLLIYMAYDTQGMTSPFRPLWLLLFKTNHGV